MTLETKTFIKEIKSDSKIFGEWTKSLKTPLPPTSRLLLRNIFKKIRKCAQTWETRKNPILNTIAPLTFQKVKEIAASDFQVIPSEFQTTIEQTCDKQTRVTFDIPYTRIPNTSRTYQIYICTSSSCKDNVLYGIIRKVFWWLCIVNDDVEASCSKTVNVFLYMIDPKKNMPHSHETLDRHHANTAFTTTCQIHTNIHIFRKEEWFRALIHETFHNLGLDFIRLDSAIVNSEVTEIKKVFPISVPDIRFYETYCETWAELLNTCFYVYGMNSMATQKKLITEFQNHIQYEQMFSLLQCVKLLAHNNIDYNNFSQNAHLYKENTQGFSYFVLKCISMVHYGQFLEFCATQRPIHRPNTRTRKNEGNAMKKYTRRQGSVASSSSSLSSIVLSDNIFDFVKNKKNLANYRKLFTGNAKSDKMTNGVNFAKQFHEKMKSKKNNTLTNTLRMSILESQS